MQMISQNAVFSCNARSLFRLVPGRNLAFNEKTAFRKMVLHSAVSTLQELAIGEILNFFVLHSYTLNTERGIQDTIYVKRNLERFCKRNGRRDS